MLPTEPPIRNEQLKLRANFVNTLASASVVAGVTAPLAAAIYGLSAAPADLPRFFVGLVIWLAVGGSLHGGATLVLRRLQP